VSTRRIAMIKKPFIFFCDDKPKWTDKFKARHGENFEIKTTNKSSEFVRELTELVRRGQIPDIILIDLYHPRDTDNGKREELDIEGQAAIDRLVAAIKKEKVPILEAWEPLGYLLLEKARKLCPHTPIALYTEQGLTLASNAELERVSKANGEWFLKGTEGLYEDDRLERMLRTNLYAHTTRNTLWILSIAIIIATLGYLLFVERAIDYTISFGATLVSLAIAIMPRVISYIVQKKQRG
jgi:hypothetical protein